MPIEINDIHTAVAKAMRESGDDDGKGGGENLAETAAAGKVSVSGKEYIHSISSIKLEQSVHDHHRAVVRLNFAGSDSPSLDDVPKFVGEQITIRIGDQLYADDRRFPVAFAGIVTSVRIVTETNAETVAVIIAESPTVKMEFGHVNKTYLNQKASDMISGCISQVGLGGGTVDGSTVTYEHMFQYQETNWEFARRMAASYGVFLFYDGEKLHATNAKSRPTNTIAKSDVGSLRLTLGAVGDKVQVQGWDPKEKKEIVGKGTGKDASGMDSRENKTLKKSSDVHSEEDYVEAGTAVSKAHADDIAKAAAMSHIQGLAKITGQSCSFGANVGKNITVDGFGTNLNGSYFVTGVSHELNESGQYSNHFEATPTNSSYPRVPRTPTRETAVQIAIVTDNNDPQDMSRVKVRFPWREGEESFWARVVHVDAGKDRGIYTLPDVDDEVLVGFEFGDPSHPIVLGSLYNGKDTPIRPVSDMVDGGKNVRKVIQTGGENVIEIEDTDGSQKITITQKDSKNSIVLSLDGPEISILSDGGAISLKAKSISLETDSGDIELKSGGKIKAQSQADTEIKATGAMKAEGMNLELKGQTNGKFEAGAMLDLKGNGMVNVKGGMINLN